MQAHPVRGDFLSRGLPELHPRSLLRRKALGAHRAKGLREPAGRLDFFAPAAVVLSMLRRSEHRACSRMVACSLFSEKEERSCFRAGGPPFFGTNTNCCKSHGDRAGPDGSRAGPRPGPVSGRDGQRAPCFRGEIMVATRQPSRIRRRPVWRMPMFFEGPRNKLAKFQSSDRLLGSPRAAPVLPESRCSFRPALSFAERKMRPAAFI